MSKPQPEPVEGLLSFFREVMPTGYPNVRTLFAKLYHHESKSREAGTTPTKQQRFAKECEAMRTRWRTAHDVDPFYSPNLTVAREDYSMACSARAIAAQRSFAQT